METLETLVAVIGADVSGLMRGLGQARQGLSGLAQDVGNDFQRIGGSLSILTGPLRSFGEQGVKVAANFEDLMTQIKVFGGVAGKELEDVRNFVLKMGADTVFSAQDAGGAMLDMLKSGMSLKEAMSGLPTVLQLATVGNMSIAEASGVVTSAMAQYHLKATDATRITEALAKGASASRADVRDLGQALGNVGPIASQFGLSIEDTTAILSVFANNGIMGAEAGTQLKSMLLNMTRPTDKVKNAYKKLGVSIYDTRGRMKNINTIIKELDASLDKLPMSEQNEMMQTLGGSYGILGLSALRAAGGISEMKKAMAAAPGAGNIADASVGTFNRALEGLRGSLETLQITVLTPFIEKVLKPLVQLFTGVVNRVVEWAKQNPQLAETLTKVLTIIVGLGPALLTAGRLMGGLINPATLLIAAIVGIGTLASEHFGGFDKMLQLAATSAQQLVMVIGYYLLDTLQKAFDTVDKLAKIISFDFFAGLLKASVAAGQLAFVVQFTIIKTLNDAATTVRTVINLIDALIKKFNDLTNAQRKNLPGGKSVLETIFPGFKNPLVKDSEPPKTGGSASFGNGLPNETGRVGGGFAAFSNVGSMATAARGKAFASGGYTGQMLSTKPAGIVHGREFVVPERGALVMKGGGGGYSGPQYLRVMFQADDFLKQIDVSIAQALGAR